MQHLKNNDISEGGYVVICEGEFDQMMLTQAGIMAITSTTGATNFKEEWITKLEAVPKIYICLDNDEAGEKGTERIINLLSLRYPTKHIHHIRLPKILQDKKMKDISDYFLAGGTVDDLMGRYNEQTSMDMSRFLPMTTTDILRILGLTIKKDDLNKVVVFLAMLSAFTEDSQFNILLSAPSASGKSYIPLEIAKLFPQENIMELLYVSQNAFFHENGEYDKEKNEIHIHLERKIIIFIDQPCTELLGRLRPLLSHDRKCLTSKITDKTGKGGNKTKTVVIHGYPVAIFCTASSKIDEQEATRFFVISPETTQEKLSESICAKIRSGTERHVFQKTIDNNPERNLLKERIQMIRDAHIDHIELSDGDAVRNIFLSDKQYLRPRDQRDIDRFMGIIKMSALLNLPFRQRE